MRWSSISTRQNWIDYWEVVGVRVIVLWCLTWKICYLGFVELITRKLKDFSPPICSRECCTYATVSQTMHLAKILARRKTEDVDGDRGGAKLKRVLGLGDLTMLGVGSTLGLGVYVLAGSVARSDAGPAVTISFLIAAIASAFAGICYAEFAARVPKAGSAYVYSYVTVGELAAFIIGWNLILEYVIGTASVARGLSNYIDSLLSHAMSSALTEVMPINVSWLSPYPDFLSCGFVLVLSILLAWGVKESSFLNNVFTAVNLFTVALVIVVGAFYIDIKNWTVDPAEAPTTDQDGKPVVVGLGGFAPFGISGIMAGAAKCFYGFVGFDCVATTGEEAKNPKRDIPLSIILSLIIIFLAYFGISSVLTLMYPYYLQDVDAPLPFVFGKVGLNIVKYIVSTGAIFALCTSLLGAMFPLPRVLYAMSHDGLLFEYLCSIHPTTLTPVLATLSAGVFAGVMAAIFNVDQLIDMMSIGTLLAYTIVAICVLILRYRDPNPVMYEQPNIDHPSAMSSIKDVFNLTMIKYPSRTTENISSWALTVYIMATAALCVTLVNGEDALVEGSAAVVTVVCVLAAVMVITIFIIHRQPQSQSPLAFKVPLLPLLPCVSVLINFYLMCKLDVHTWIRFGVWLFIGMLIYIFYSIPNSVEGMKARVAKSANIQTQVKLPPTTPTTAESTRI
ncbi:high affinity cationic amino acid transporter 1 [Macrosteles quadrilineatus]|uniref:high affinity cationic amino acid transporter 1 n=1 Tax=Macrosteles quadrilineatus TaxID=74068 RepID=UPI0023E218B2|nr:high affinity cationic amino acid transporter 1 [Macrosteles quadrilineatus]